VQMRVMGPDRQEVRKIADQVKARFSADPQLSAVHDDWLEPVPAMKLVIDQDRARALGVTSQRVRQMLQTAMTGAPLDTFRDGEETVSIVAREPDGNRSLLSAVDSVYVPTDFGGFVPISQIAKVEPVMEQGIEWRRDRLPTISVRASLPTGYKVEIQGGAEDSAESQASIAAKAPIMLVVIVLLLMAQLQHFGKAMLVLATGPLGIIGAAAALLISGAPFGFVAILGVIALLGIIMRNSIILVDQIDQDIAAGMERSEAIVGADRRAGADPDLARRLLGAIGLRHDGRHSRRHRAHHPGAAGWLRSVLRAGAQEGEARRAGARAGKDRGHRKAAARAGGGIKEAVRAPLLPR